MKLEKEITVIVNTDYKTIDNILKTKEFKILEEYTVEDIYMINKNIDITKLNSLDILKKCILVRDIIGIKKELVYKYKEYDKYENIIEQGKVECEVQDINKAKEFMEKIDYIKLIDVKDKCIVYSNNDIELVVQLVNDKYIFIEIEATKNYPTIESMIDKINSLNLPIDTSSYFVKKAQLVYEDSLVL